MTRSICNCFFITLAIVAFYCLDLVPYYHASSVAVGKALLLLFESSVFLFLISLKDIVKANNIDKAVLVYIIMLALRLVVDFVIKGNVFFVYQNTITIFVFYTGLTIIPYMFFSRVRCTINPKLLVVALFLVFLGALVMSLQNIINGSAEASTSDRFSGEGGFSILYGHLGVSLFFISLCLRYIELPRLIKMAMMVVGVFVGILSMIFSGSRGPFVAFIVLSVVYFFINANNRKWRLFVVILLVFIAVFFKSIMGWVNELLESFDILSFNRVYQTFVESTGDGSSGRDTIFMNALNDFIENPIFGKAYLLENGSYVHNIFIEQFRALGLVGGILFMVFTLYAIRKGFKVFKKNKKLLIIYLLFIQYIVYGCFSSSIIAIPQYWVGLYVVLNYVKQYGISHSHHSNIRLQGEA